MFRRILLLMIGVLLVSEPVYSQTWLQRYLRERKAKEEAKKAADQPEATPTPQPMDPSTQPTGPSEEIRRAEPVSSPAAEEPTTPAAPATPAITPVPVRRAELAEPASNASVPVRRAEPVTPEVSFDSVPVRRAEPVEPIPAPTPVPPPPNPATPRVVVAPTPVPVPAVPIATPSPTPNEMDPNTNVIRIAPSNKPVAPDVNQFNYADLCYSRKEYDKAAVEYERYLNLYGYGANREAALFRLAESHRQLQNFNAARKSYEELILNFSEGDFVGPTAYRLADICFQEKNYVDALAYYRKASIRIKDPVILLSSKFYIARCLEILKLTSEAVAAYQDLLLTTENNPFLEASRLGLARLLADSGRKTEALAQYESLVKETTKPSLKAEITVREGLLLLDMGKGDKAVVILKKALEMPELGSWKEVAEVSLLRVLYSNQSYQQVIDAYGAHATQFSAEAQPEVLLIVANSNRQLGKDKEAMALYEKIVSEFPDSAYVKDAQYYRLIALYNANDPRLLAEVDLFLTQNPEASDKRDQLILLKAEALYKAKKYSEAAPLYAVLDSSRLSTALKAEALFKFGWCETQMEPRDNAAAIQAFSAFLSQYPAHKLAATALAQRAQCYQQTKNLQAALADFDSLLGRYPKASKERELALQQKALILGDRNDYRGMSAAFKILLNEFPESPRAGQANYWIGWAAIDAKNYKEAIHPLEEARKLDKERFGEKSTLLLLQAHRFMENRQALAAEVDKAGETKIKVPAEYLRWTGTEFFQAGDAAHSEKYLAKLVKEANPAELQPEDWLLLGSVRTKLQKWNDAESTLKAYLEKVNEPSQQATGHLALGEAQLGAKHFEDAQKAADAALSLQPEGRLNAQGRLLSGDVAMARGDFLPAAKLYYSVSLVFGDDPEITPKALAQAYLAYKKAGDTKQAAKTLNELQSHYPEYKVPSA